MLVDKIRVFIEYQIVMDIYIITLIEHVKQLAEDTTLSEHIHKCKLTVMF